MPLNFARMSKPVRKPVLPLPSADDLRSLSRAQVIFAAGYMFTSCSTTWIMLFAATATTTASKLFFGSLRVASHTDAPVAKPSTTAIFCAPFRLPITKHAPTKSPLVIALVWNLPPRWSIRCQPTICPSLRPSRWASGIAMYVVGPRLHFALS